MENAERYNVLKSYPTVNGILYEGETVILLESINGKLRCKDRTGKIWFLSGDEIELIEGDINE